jgi:hypothetical protein
VSLKRIKSGWQVYVYDRETKRKVYVGVRPTQREAKQLERETMLSGDKMPAGAMVDLSEKRRGA